MSGDGYHHGNLRRAVLDAAVEAIAESGPATWSLRELARRAGVSHAAPAHHFGDKTGLLTAVAAEGYALFADALEAAGDDLHDVGLAYVRFAVGHRAHFEVMFTPALYRADDPGVGAARERAALALREGVRGVAPGGPQDDRTAGIAAWSIVHGFAHLWLSGALPDLGDDPVSAAGPVIRLLFER
ncbi:TetR/AcrR family transcriptional regulator [Actinomadura madurae]|uniref:TetR/AcrR family transcriptional regulator n=1 Tax=Actinomadura madurae TaxID=1993 RepID=UPI0020D236A1|nr:TetR/AcrR family transcriptional regulator [Actinomadura madurae]MCP9948458.1 TetR/AcrR family transcriptional regulator [Actinomadura madurae]MCP9965237.1 TetR/AcrR family transcriptional regulator [Actinomadura madurae]MCP9977727.1 TetR/AcrR family transcriptional regulator [Actinomadura madurae]MCQ0010783.1 TetR/AcrR family transcriptional regulator [Actinomadura madurae]